MGRLWRDIVRLPAHLAAMMAAFAMVPPWSLTFMPAPWEIAAGPDELRAAVTLLVYWIGPLAIAGLVAMRSAWLLGVFALECLALVAYASLDVATDPTLHLVRLSLLGVMAVVGIFLVMPDTLHPLLFRHRRGFRRAVRLPVTRRAYLLTDASGSAARAKVMVENLSLTGLAFTGERAAIETLLGDVRIGRSLRLALQNSAGKGPVIVAEVVWTRGHDAFLQIGATTEEASAMAAFIESLGRRLDGRGLWATVQRVWAVTSLRRGAVALWMACLVGAFGMPACGELHAGAATVGQLAMADVPVAVDSRRVGLPSDELAITLRIEGCHSGYTMTYESARELPLQVPVGDVGCRARVVALKTIGRSYHPDPEASFARGDQVRFAGKAGDLHATVRANLDEPAADTRRFSLELE